MSTPELTSAPKQISVGMTWLFAIVGGAAVGNLYWAQPLLATIAKSLDVPIGSAGALVTISGTNLTGASAVMFLAGATIESLKLARGA